jgi:hypothetical protein
MPQSKRNFAKFCDQNTFELMADVPNKLLGILSFYQVVYCFYQWMGLYKKPKRNARKSRKEQKKI